MRTEEEKRARQEQKKKKEEKHARKKRKHAKRKQKAKHTHKITSMRVGKQEKKKKKKKEKKDEETPRESVVSVESHPFHAPLQAYLRPVNIVGGGFALTPSGCLPRFVHAYWMRHVGHNAPPENQGAA